MTEMPLARKSRFVMPKFALFIASALLLNACAESEEFSQTSQNKNWIYDNSSISEKDNVQAQKGENSASEFFDKLQFWLGD